jgi:hypothetical protein
VNRVTPSFRWGCRIYAALVLLYPAILRRQFGEEMIEVFAEQMRDACRKNGWVGGMGVWRWSPEKPCVQLCPATCGSSVSLSHPG